MIRKLAHASVLFKHNQQDEGKYSDTLLAERYASKAESIASQVPHSSEALLVRPVCQLAVAYANEHKNDLAKQKLDECMTLAGKVKDAQSQAVANAANALVHLWTNDLGAAEDSLKYLLANAPANSEILLELAIAFVNKGEHDKGIAQFDEAIKQLKSTNNVDAAAAAFERMALALGSSPQYKKQQLEYLHTAVTEYQQASNLNGMATVNIDLGTYYLNAGDNKIALTYLQQAEALGKNGHNARASGQATVLMGNVYNAGHDYKKAEDFHRRGADVYRTLDDKAQEAMVRLLVAQDMEAQGNLSDALMTCRAADEIAVQSGADLADYWASRTLGDIYERQGEFTSSANAYKKAVEIAARTGQQQNEAYAELQLDDPYEILGQWDEALGVAEKALETFRTVNDMQGEEAADATLGELYGDRTSSIRDFDKALTYYQKATALGYASNADMLEIYIQKGQFADAIKAGHDVVEACVKAHNDDCQAHALISLSEAQRKSADLSASASALKEAQRVGTKSTDYYLQGRLLYGKAGQERAEGHLQQAASSYEQLISLIETVKGQGGKTQRSMAESYGFIYDELVSTLFAMSDRAQGPEKNRLASLALQYAETNKARQFADSWGRSFVTELRRTLPADLQETERELIEERDRLATTVEDKGSAVVSNSIEKRVDDFAEGLRRSYPQYAAVAYPEPVTLENLPLRNNEVFVEYKVTDDSTLIWAATGTNGNKVALIGFYMVAKPRQWFVERVSTLRTALNSARPDKVDWHISEELFDQLFPDPLRKTLLQAKSVVFVPDDILSVIPFEILSSEASKGHFPLLGTATTYYPSAAALRLSRVAKGSSHWQDAFLGVGDPITSPEDQRYEVAAALPATRGGVQISSDSEFSGSDLATIKSRGFSFDRLPATAEEVQGIAKLFQSQGQLADVRLGSDATKQRLIDTDLTRFRFLHFATHGILPLDSNVKEPALVLSYDGSTPERMLLSTTEILGLKTHAENVVLSACNTGNGILSRSEGVMSLGRAFMAAGAESVTVSLWQVADNSTEVLMEQFYKNILNGKSKSEALAAARTYLSADSRFRDPYYWAPFILIGN